MTTRGTAEEERKKEPSVDSTDREERILARRARLRERLAKEKAKGTPAEAAEAEREKLRDRTIEEVAADEERAVVDKSLSAIDSARREADSSVSALKVEAEEAEQRRRAEHDKVRSDLARDAAREREQSAAAIAVVRGAWREISECTVPDEQAEMIERQKARAAKVLEARDKLVRAHRVILKEKVDEFQKASTRQGEEIEGLLARIRKIGAETGRLLDAEVAKVEEHLEKAREALRREYEARLEELRERRSGLERRMAEARLDQRRDGEAVEDSAARRVAEDCAQLKARLEEEVQALQLSLQQMKATYVMNTEKLDHNMRLLAQREALHAEQIAAGKAKINRLQDVLTQLKVKSSRLEKQYTAKLAELSDEFGRLIATYKDYSRKFTHFRDADAKKLEEVWALTMERAHQDVAKLLTADRVIHERVLGLAWNPPQKDVFGETPKVATELAQGPRADEAGTPRQREFPAGSLEEQVLSMLCEEAGFLVDEQKASAIFDLAAEAEEGRGAAGAGAGAGGTAGSSAQPQQKKASLGALLDALHVTERADVEKLMSYFLIEVADTSAAVGEARGEEGGIMMKTVMVSREQAMAALRAFAEEHQKDASLLLRRRDRDDLGEALDEERRAQKLFWDHVLSAVSDRSHRLWKGVLEELGSFQQVLRRRVELLEQNRQLKLKNAEMKARLNRFITHPVEFPLPLPSLSKQPDSDFLEKPLGPEVENPTSRDAGRNDTCIGGCSISDIDMHRKGCQAMKEMQWREEGKNPH